jgi:hypothetical protein
MTVPWTDPEFPDPDDNPHPEAKFIKRRRAQLMAEAESLNEGTIDRDKVEWLAEDLGRVLLGDRGFPRIRKPWFWTTSHPCPMFGGRYHRPL